MEQRICFTDENQQVTLAPAVLHIIVPNLETDLPSSKPERAIFTACSRRGARRTRTAAGRRELHGLQARPRFRINAAGVQHEPQHSRTREADVVPERPVPPSCRAQYRQGQDHRRSAARTRLSAVVLRQSGRGQLSQSRHALITNTTSPKPTASLMSLAGWIPTGTEYAKTTRTTQSFSHW